MKIVTAIFTQRRQAPGFLGASLLIFFVAMGETVAWNPSMGTSSNMPSMWLPMCGQSWASLAVSFLSMWSVMMVAMMMPVLAPMLWRYRESVRDHSGVNLFGLIMMVGAGYYFVWNVIGVAVFALGAAVAEAKLQLPALTRYVPIATGVVVLLAGTVQFTRWKMQHLAHCRWEPGTGQVQSPDMPSAWRHGLRLGRHCIYCCGNLMIILLLVGIMNLPAMILVTAAVIAERLAHASAYVVYTIGIVVIGAGCYLISVGTWPA